MIQGAPATDSLRLYVDAFAHVSRAAAPDPSAWVEADGLVGCRGTSAQPTGRLLVTDDRALPTLLAIGDPDAQLVIVDFAADGTLAHVRTWDGFHEESATAMVMGDLRAVPDLPLPTGLTLRPVDVHSTGAGVPLEAAADAARRAEPAAVTMSSAAFQAMLRSIPSVELLAAMDHAGEVRATAGSIVVAEAARVIFVSTDEAYRGRGVGTAMTAAALQSACHRGARVAALDATPTGRSIYARLGFDRVTEVVIFLRT